MKRTIFAMSIALAAPAVAQAAPPTKAHVREYRALYRTVRRKFGKRAPGCNLMSTCHTKVTDARLMKSLGILERFLMPVSSPSSTSTPISEAVSASVNSSSSYAPVVSGSPSGNPAQYAGGSLSDVPGVPSSFAACVAYRESTNGQLSSNVYGILGSGGQGNLAQQKQAFSQMYASRGTEPWAPYDGC